MKLRCLIIDDEYPARVLLSEYVNKLSQLELIAACKNPLEAIAFLEKENIDLIFLDIQMPELTGIEFLKTLQQPPQIIFTTAYADYALTGYDLNVTDYLLKPISLERFIQSVNKAATNMQVKKNSLSANNPSTEFISIKADYKIYRVNWKDILYVEGLREYVTFFTTSGKIITLGSLKNLEAALPQNKFMRVHKSYIVNKEKVKALFGNQLEIEGKHIPIGKSYKEEVMKIFE